MTSEARARPRDEEGAVLGTEPAGPGPGPGPTLPSGTASAQVQSDAPVGDDPRRRRDASVAALVLAVLLALFLAAAGYLWFTRPGTSAVRYEEYGQALMAARSGVVDLTSFDHLTLDDDIEQIRRVATGDLREESVDQLDQRRQEITEAQAVVNTEVVGAGVTRVDDDEATALLIIQSTQESTASEQAQIVRYRIEVTLEREGGRWLLSGIKGTESPGND